MKLNRLFRWVTDIWCWLAEGKIVFMFILVLVAALTLGLVTWHSETSIRFAGYILQVLGMIFAIDGLLDVRAHFEQPPLWQLFVSWLKRFPKWIRSVIVNVGTGQLVITGMKVRGEVWTPDKPDQPIEKWIEGIVKNLDRIRKEQGEHTKFIEELRDNLKEHKKKVADDSQKMEEKRRTELESLLTSGIVKSLVGLIWLMVGISMSTMFPELFKLVQALSFLIR